MPIKKIANTISLSAVHHAEILSFFTNNKRNHFDSDSKLFATIESNVKGVSNVFSAHLTTYPLIAVHVRCGDHNLLQSKQADLQDKITNALEIHLKQT